MAPLPSNPSDLHPSIARRLEDIETYQLPRLARCKGPIGLQRELADETKDDLEQIRRNVEICKEIGEGLRMKQREENLTICHAFEERYRRLHTEYRRAVLDAKANLTTSSSSRHLLRSSSTDKDPHQLHESTSQASRPAESNMADDALQSRTNEVTDALRRTTETMQAELERSVLSVQMLEDSTRTLRSTANLYDTYTSLLEASGHLIKQLEKADWWDRLTILAAFLFFLLCVGWILKRRILDKVVGGVGWWVGGSFKLLGMGLGLGGGGGRRVGPVTMSTGTGTVTVTGTAVPEQTGQVGAGQVGKTPPGIGRVGLAGGKPLPKKGAAVQKDLDLESGDQGEQGKVSEKESVLDKVVPPNPHRSGDSAVRPGSQTKDEL